MEMYYCNSKGGIHTPALILAMLMMIMMLLDAYCCGASVLAKSNTSFRCSDGRLDECLIEEDLELELGFLMNPYVSRILADQVGTGGAENPNNQAISCGQHQDTPQYSQCIARVQASNNQCTPRHIHDRSCPP
ncbi:hypothetical protein I3760_03G114400 [Carya illinoinensis]|nr:hypothetical protein I3760_03G114400 [Carya illinoinensis]